MIPKKYEKYGRFRRPQEWLDIYIKENKNLKAKLEIAVKALREIESQDYRGNRPSEHAIAFKALNTLDSL